MLKPEEMKISKGCHCKVKVEDAVGLPLAHDITEIRPGEFKGPSFRKGHEVAHEDLCHLMRLIQGL